MDRQCVFINAEGQTCPNEVRTGLFCAEHSQAQSNEKARADKPRGGAGGGGGWSIMGRTGVVYQKKD